MDIQDSFSQLFVNSCNSGMLEDYLKAELLVAYSKAEELMDEEKLLEIESFINNLALNQVVL